jgi:DNA-binding CsgD family transcriptional regulator
LVSKIDESLALAQNPEVQMRQNTVAINQHNLTINDIELLKLLSDGLSNKQIAEIKSITTKSCENAIARLAKKLKVLNTPETNQRVLMAKEYLKLSGKDF